MIQERDNPGPLFTNQMVSLIHPAFAADFKIESKN